MHKGKIGKFDEVEIWGSGAPLREFMHVDDLSSAIEFLIETNSSHELLNIGSNESISIKELAKLIKKVVNYEGELSFNSSYPDGNPKKLLDSSKLNSLGWQSSISLEEGIKDTYNWYVKNIN